MNSSVTEIEKKPDDGGSLSSSAPEHHSGLRTVYFHPVTQVVMLGLVCFMCPGLYNALNGLGGGGRVDTTTNANANATHYATFAFFAFFAGQVEHSSSAALGTYTVRFGSFSQAHQQRPRTPTGSSYW